MYMLHQFLYLMNSKTEIVRTRERQFLFSGESELVPAWGQSLLREKSALLPSPNCLLQQFLTRESLVKAWTHGHGRNDQEESSFTPSRSFLSKPNLRACLFLYHHVPGWQAHWLRSLSDSVCLPCQYSSRQLFQGTCGLVVQWCALSPSGRITGSSSVCTWRGSFGSLVFVLHEMHVLSEVAPSKIASCIHYFFYLNYWRGFFVEGASL